MKKLLLAVLCLSMLSPAYGASEDVYVRQDVFDAKMEALFSRLHGEIEALGNKINGKIDALSVEIKGDIKALSERVDGNFMALSNRIDGLEKRVEDTHNFLYYLLVVFAAIVLLSYINKWWEERKERKEAAQPSITLDDVKRLIAEAKLSMPQV